MSMPFTTRGSGSLKVSRRRVPRVCASTWSFVFCAKSFMTCVRSVSRSGSSVRSLLASLNSLNLLSMTSSCGGSASEGNSGVDEQLPTALRGIISSLLSALRGKQLCRSDLPEAGSSWTSFESCPTSALILTTKWWTYSSIVRTSFVFMSCNLSTNSEYETSPELSASIMSKRISNCLRSTSIAMRTSLNSVLQSNPRFSSLRDRWPLWSASRALQSRMNRDFARWVCCSLSRTNCFTSASRASVARSTITAKTRLNKPMFTVSITPMLKMTLAG
mmetsp:Transcript_66582/g.184365  ORF Transcript_66582/g.184365 Transcript_66582/m.184365 type:complete len:275 (+) Transcript_66582:367-1191(+)